MCKLCVYVYPYFTHFCSRKIKVKQKVPCNFHSLSCISTSKRFIFRILLATLYPYHFALNSLVHLMTLYCKYLITFLFSRIQVVLDSDKSYFRFK